MNVRSADGAIQFLLRSARPRKSNILADSTFKQEIILKHDAKLPKGHQTWQLNEVSRLIWPSPNGIGITDKAAFDRTVQIAVDSKILKAAPTGTPYRNDLAEKAIAALGSSVDTKGTSWQPATVTLTQDGK